MDNQSGSATVVQVACFNRRRMVFDYRVVLAGAPERPWQGQRVLLDLQGRLQLGLVVSEVKSSMVPLSKLKPILLWVEEEWPLPKVFWEKVKWACAYYGGDSTADFPAFLPKWLGLISSCRSGGGVKLRAFRSPLQGPATDYTELKFTAGPQGLRFESSRSVPLRQRASSLSPPTKPQPSLIAPPDLNEEQKAALRQLLKGELPIKLLYGVTASGKTQVYGRFMQAMWEQERKPMLVLVPEIGLIPSMVQQMERFGFNCEAYHGLLSDQRKFEVWQKVCREEVQVVCGTRSAVWLPFQSLGAVVVDEEHDSAYKNQHHPREHARDVACWMARQLGARVILGSATPSLETLHNVAQGKFDCLTLSSAASSMKQILSVIWNPNEPLERRKRVEGWSLGPSYREAILSVLEAKQHVLIMLNRRGFAEKVLCKFCHQFLKCPGCDHPYRFHSHSQQLRCTVCQSLQPFPHHCPECEAQTWVDLGIGTEKLMGVLEEVFPEVPICRCDQDTVPDSSLLFDRLQKFFEGGAPGILLGTQMISKGHDFKSIGLSLLLGADHAFFSQDLKAEERLCQMYTQVLGRVAREGGVGTIMVATKFHDHPLLQALERGGYWEAAQVILAERRAVRAFPWTRWLQVWAESASSSLAEAALKDSKGWLMKGLKSGGLGSRLQASHCTLLGPYAAPQPKRMGRYRWLLDVGIEEGFSRERFSLIKGLGRWIAGQPDRKVRIWVDIDPQALS